ncbi:MAG: HD domain-containing protein [Candidatus Omnitrophica bacterium]|nr:HD domain-containing protein [Candidatus Omnitrophota bacterium]
MRLLNDLYTIYGDLLVEKNTEITPAVIKKIRKMGEAHKQARVPLKNTELFADFDKVFYDPKYANILKPPAVKKQVCDIAGALAIENDLIFELSTMKQNLPYTYHHVLIVAALTIRLSLAYKPGKFDKDTITHCGFTHDIGKTRIPISILNKPGKLTSEERMIMETHPVMGYLLLNYYLKKDRVICSIAGLDHHERLDGSGYPKGIKKIDKYSQLISVVDVLDALMTKRPYRGKSFSLRASLDYLLFESDRKRFDRDIVVTLICLARKEKTDPRHIKISREFREELPEEMTHEKYV